MAFFCKTMEIKYIDEKTIEKLVYIGIDDIIKLIYITIKDFMKLEGFGELLSNKIYKNINKRIK